MAAERERLAGLETRWQQEKELVDSILELRGKLRAGGKPVDDARKPTEPRPRRPAVRRAAEAKPAAEPAKPADAPRRGA